MLVVPEGPVTPFIPANAKVFHKDVMLGEEFADFLPVMRQTVAVDNDALPSFLAMIEKRRRSGQRLRRQTYLGLNTPECFGTVTCSRSYSTTLRRSASTKLCRLVHLAAQLMRTHVLRFL